MPKTGSMHYSRSASAILLAAGFFGCASAPAPASQQPRPPSSSARSSAGGHAESQPIATVGTAGAAGGGPPPQRSDVACPARIAPGAVRRSALGRTLDAGLGSWLRGVDVEPKIERGRFQGWLVRSIHPGDPCWADVDLRPGDVVSRINRRPIERPEEAQAVWSALRGAGEIVVELVRGREARTLRFTVMDDGDGS